MHNVVFFQESGRKSFCFTHRIANTRMISVMKIIWSRPPAFFIVIIDYIYFFDNIITLNLSISAENINLVYD